jgi:hypothetical protein
VSGSNPVFPALIALSCACFPAVAAGDPGCCAALSADPDSRLCPDRGFSLLLPQPLGPKTFLFLVEHRGNSPAFSSPFRDGLGLDNGALKIGLGLRYSPIDNLDAGIRRVNNGLDLFDTYEFDARYRFLDESSQGLDAAIDAGISLFTQDTHGIASGMFAACIAGRSFPGRLYIASGAQYHSNSTFSEKTTDAIDWSLAIPLLFSFRASTGLSLLTEWFVPAAGYSAGNPGYAFGFKYATWRHNFSLLLSNSQYTTTDGTVSGSNRLNDPVLGFMIVRKFGGD